MYDPMAGQRHAQVGRRSGATELDRDGTHPTLLEVAHRTTPSLLRRGRHRVPNRCECERSGGDLHERAGPAGATSLGPPISLSIRCGSRTAHARPAMGRSRIGMPVWVEPLNEGGTPMCAAMDRAGRIAHSWIQTYPQSFPPIVINLSDGESTDGDAATWARTTHPAAFRRRTTVVVQHHARHRQRPDTVDVPARSGSTRRSVRPPTVRDVQRAARVHAHRCGPSGGTGLNPGHGGCR